MMNILIERAIEVLKSLPEEKQIALASAIIDAEELYVPTDAEQRAIDEGLADVAAGRTVDMKEVQERWRKRSVS